MMDRRHFCKIAGLAAGAIGLSRAEGRASILSRDVQPSHRTMRRDCVVTVMRKECYMDLQALYLDDPESGACSAFSVREEFRLQKGAACPDGFCKMAWEMLCGMVGNINECSPSAVDGVVVAACPDGTRPVIFRIEIV